MIFLIMFFIPALISVGVISKWKKIENKNDFFKKYVYYFLLINSLLCVTTFIICRDSYDFIYSVFSIKYVFYFMLEVFSLSIVMPIILEKKFKDKKNIILLTVLMFTLFYIYDFVVRYVIGRNEVLVYPINSLSSELFTFGFVILFILFIFCFKRKRIVFNILNIIFFIFFIFFISQYFHYFTLDRAYNLYDIFTVSEGLQYWNFLVKAITKELVFVIFIMFILTIVINKKIGYEKHIRFNKQKVVTYFISLMVSILCFTSAYFLLGKKNNLTFFADAVSPKNIFVDFDNCNRSLKVSGLYLYTTKNIYTFIKDNYFSEDYEELKNKFDKEVKGYEYKHKGNSYTGILKDKSVVYVLLESIDSPFINKEVTPTIYKMKKEGYDFTNRYAPNYGTGRTFDTEFAMNTALHQPLNGNASLNLVNNDFKYSIANVFNKAGYKTSSFHQNSGSFYHRDTFHENLGYQNINMGLTIKYKEKFQYDTALVENEKVYKLLTPEEKFMDFIITYSGHGPYTNVDVFCDDFLEKYPEFKDEENYELSCLKAKFKETDEFLRIFQEKLKKENRIDDVVFVLVSDHYAYNYSKIKEIRNTTDENLISKTPLIIYNTQLEPKKINTIMGTYDILPTIANLVDVKYEPTFSVGTDVFDETHKDFVYFLDNSWIDNNNVYSRNLKECDEYCININKKIDKYVEINDLILKSNYYSKK